MKTGKVNYESDFKIIEGFKDGSSILAAPFRFTYYTKVSRGVYVAEYNGSEFVNCHPSEDGRVIVPFDSPKLGMGVLMVKREFFLNDSDFNDGICNLVSVESTGITLDKGATDMDGEVNIELFPFYQQGETGKSAYQEWLDLGNEGSIEDFFSFIKGEKGDTGVGIEKVEQTTASDEDSGLNIIFVTMTNGEQYQFKVRNGSKGDKGDTFTYDDLTQAQKEDLSYQVIGEAENERRAAELVRQENEVKREAQEDVRTETFNANEGSREQAFNAAQKNRDTEFQNAETNRSNTFFDNEVSRQQSFEANEQERQSIFSANESERQASESARVTAEGARKSAEALRKQAEEDRENTFATNEKSRQDTFATNESARQSAFVSNEAIREANEILRQEAEVIREGNERRREETYKQKVDRDDNAPKLTAGFANNLVGRGEATSQEISFRPSGGDTSIEDGTARIDRVKGSTLVWNQFAPVDLSKYNLVRGTGRTEVGGVATATAAEAGKTSYFYLSAESILNKKGRKFYTCVYVKASSTKAKVFAVGMKEQEHIPATGDWQKIEYIQTNNTWSGAVIGAGIIVADELVTYSIKGLSCVDLTQMFGEGNEPATIEEFHARKPINIDEYAYNEGELISNNAEELKSVGFNAWDEEWELGSFFNGAKVETTATWRNKNDIVIVPNKQYRFEIGSPIYINAFDRYGNYLYAQRIEESGSKTFDKNEHHIWIRPYDDVTTYNHDICIHLVHTGYRNGEYEPYKEFRRNIPIKDIKDKDGNQLFPNGLLSAGSAHDEVTATKAIKRIGVLPLRDVAFGLISENRYFYSSPLIFANYSSNTNISICSHYQTKPWGGNGGFTYEYARERKPSLALWRTAQGYERVNILDDSVADAEELKALLTEKNVMLYYELAEPIEVDLPEPLNLDYEVSDFGTEEVLSSEPTTPMKADIVYLFNAVDRIRDNSRHTAEAEIKLKDYETRIAALEAIVASLTSNES